MTDNDTDCQGDLNNMWRDFTDIPVGTSPFVKSIDGGVAAIPDLNASYVFQHFYKACHILRGSGATAMRRPRRRESRRIAQAGIVL